MEKTYLIELTKTIKFTHLIEITAKGEEEANFKADELAPTELSRFQNREVLDDSKNVLAVTDLKEAPLFVESSLDQEEPLTWDSPGIGKNG